MSGIEERIKRLEDAVIAIASMTDPAELAAPITDSGHWTQARNRAARDLAALVTEISSDSDRKVKVGEPAP